jgi:two-component system cell cycle sensor histidine kinase/response regulator CckA
MPNGGELEIRMENVSFLRGEAVPPRKAGDFVRLVVADTGEGIKPEHLPRLFDPYFTTKEFGQGTGLGLSIANSLIVEHGGWIEVETGPGRGTRFSVCIPRAHRRATSAERGNARAGLAETDEPDLSGSERVLIVDDEEVVRLVIRTILSYRGYQVHEAATGEEAIRKCPPGSAPFDLILLDLNMPWLSGWETLQRLLETGVRIPVIMLSGGPSDGVALKAKEAGAAGLLLKPFQNVELLRLVRRTIDAAKQG